MGKRFEEEAYARLLDAVEVSTGKTFTERERFFLQPRRWRGRHRTFPVSKRTMASAYLELRRIRDRYDNRVDLRTAAFISAIDKIALCYQDLGIFP